MYESLLDDPDLHPNEEMWMGDTLDLMRLELEQAKSELSMYQSISADVEAGDYSGLNEIELNRLEKDYLFVARTGEVESSPIIPSNQVIFMPNAYINYRLSDWKNEQNINFVPPGGP